MQFNNFSTQSPKCMHRGSICSPIVVLLNDSIISKIRRWRIELWGGENPGCGEGGGRGSAYLNSSANNLNSSCSIRFQYYWVYTYFLIEYRPFEEIKNIENPSMAHWVIWWWKTWVRRRRRTPHSIEFGVRKTSRHNNFMTAYRIWVFVTALKSAWLTLQLGRFRFLQYSRCMMVV